MDGKPGAKNQFSWIHHTLAIDYLLNIVILFLLKFLRDLAGS
jgi:hypothetical protein